MTREEELDVVIAETYQVLGVLAHEAGRFDDPAVIKALDNLAAGGLEHTDVLPFESGRGDVLVAFNEGWNAALQSILLGVREVEDRFRGDSRRTADRVMSEVRSTILSRKLHM